MIWPQARTLAGAEASMTKSNTIQPTYQKLFVLLFVYVLPPMLVC